MAKKKSIGKIGTGKRAILLSAVVVLGVVGYYFVFYREKADQLEQLREEYRSLVAQEQEWEKRQKTYIQDVEDLNRRKERQREQVRILPPDAEMSSFLTDLDNLSGLSGLELKTVQPKDEQGAGFYAKIPVALVLEGRFHQVLKFFYSIGKLERIINIENINFAAKPAASAGGGDAKLNVSVQATTFRSLEKATAPGRQGG